MDVTMNIDAVTWFAREIFPQIRQTVPNAEFQIVGRNPSSEVLALDREEGIEVTGRVDEVRDFYENAAVAVVPLRRGGGTKLKVPEAMAARVPVVATSVGAQGLEIEDGVHLQVADEADAFAEATSRLLTHRDEARQITRAAYDRVKERYSWSSIYDDAIRRIEERVARPTTKQ
jgi:glycosyltransferase involved in cell wall biosynthesis